MHPELAAALTKLEASEASETKVGEWKRTNEAGAALETLAKAGFNDADRLAIESRYAALAAAGRLALLQALAADRARAGRTMVLPLLRKHGWVATEFGSAKGYFGSNCEAPSDQLEALVDGSISGLPDSERAELLLACAHANKLSSAVAGQARPLLLTRLQRLLATLEPRQKRTGMAWRWQDDYAEARFEADVLLDLLGYVPKEDDVVAGLRRAETLLDPLLKLWATVSLLRLGQAPAQGSARAIAADAETRNQFLDQLMKLRRQELFPIKELTQPKLAESNMVNWLAYPTELARAPDHIELMKTVEVDAGSDGGGVFVYYVFRFKNDPPDHFAKDGWLAGISGPFRKLDFPTTDAGGDTFSSFTPWNDFKAEEHLGSVQELLEAWRARNHAP
jgi:hypothetical protein